MKANYRNVAGGLVLIGVFVTAFLVSRPGSPQQSDGISWKSFDEGIALAHSTNKKVLVDVYTDWCSWCKKMDADVYPNAEVVKLLNEHFVAVKLNAESSKPVTFRGTQFTEADFAHQLGVTGYPTTLFLDSGSNPITELPGYSPADQFAKVLEYIGMDHYKRTTFQEFIGKCHSQPKNDD